MLPSPSADALIHAREQAFYLAKGKGADDIVDVVVPRAAIAELMNGVSPGSPGPARSSPGAATPVTATSTCRSSSPTPTVREQVMTDLFAARHATRRRHLGRARHRREQDALLPRARGPDEVALMQRIKAAFDPNGILNPGTFFD